MSNENNLNPNDSHQKKKRYEGLRMNQAIRHLFIKGERGVTNDVSNQNTVHRDPSQSEENTIHPNYQSANALLNGFLSNTNSHGGRHIVVDSGSEGMPKIFTSHLQSIPVLANQMSLQKRKQGASSDAQINKI